MKIVWPPFSLMVAWSLLTWSMFGWSRRAWAASVGVYLILSSVLKLMEAYAKSRAESVRRLRDQQ